MGFWEKYFSIYIMVFICRELNFIMFLDVYLWFRRDSRCGDGLSYCLFFFDY